MIFGTERHSAMQRFFALKYIWMAKYCAESGNYNHLTFCNQPDWYQRSPALSLSALILVENSKLIFSFIESSVGPQSSVNPTQKTGTTVMIVSNISPSAPLLRGASKVLSTFSSHWAVNIGARHQTPGHFLLQTSPGSLSPELEMGQFLLLQVNLRGVSLSPLSPLSLPRVFLTVVPPTQLW